MASQFFDFERAWWRLSRNASCVSNFDIYVLLRPFFSYGVNIIFMLFVFIYVYWCLSRFSFRMIFVLFNSDTTVSLMKKELITSPEHLNLPPCGSCCSVFGFLCSVLLLFWLSFIDWLLLITSLLSSNLFNKKQIDNGQFWKK